MLPRRQGAVRLFQFSGINVYLHWSWFIVAIYSIQNRAGEYSSLMWNALEYLSLFAIVLLHEFGHSLACRQVGGRANEILLWPFGGVAFVSPPPRPGAVLWSIAAGPLVNVALFPILDFAVAQAISHGLPFRNHDAYDLIVSISRINLGLLIFNMLPVYPLDGGQILRALLWFGLGPTRSLLVASGIGFLGAAGLGVFAFYIHSVWVGIMAFFVFLQCQRGWMQAQAVAKIARLPRRTGLACPSCHAAPAQGEIWLCAQCRKPFDIFAGQGVCPHCGAVHPTAQCPDCQTSQPIEKW